MTEVFLVLIAIVAISALVRTQSLSEQIGRLAAEVGRLRRELAARETPAPISMEPAGREEVPLPPPFVEEPAVDAVAPPVTPEADAAPVTAPPPPSSPPPTQLGWEQRLGARAFVWIGGITLALAAVFLVRYSIDEGYLSPEVRVILAALFGFGLIGGAERLRSRDSLVAQAMAAAGVASLYGSLFAAVALYGMVSQAMAGVAAAALTAFGVGLSLRHGIFVAVLAFVGGFVSPLVIGSEAPNIPVLFGYLLAVAAGTMIVIRHRGWWFLGWGVLAGSVLWTVAWMFSPPAGRPSGPFELHWIGIFLVAIAGLFVWATWRRLSERDNPARAVEVLVWASLCITGFLLLAIVVQDGGRQEAGWLALAAHGAGVYLLGRWTMRFQYAAILAPLLSLATLALWWYSADNASHPSTWDDAAFAWRAGLLGGLYAAGAFALMWNAPRPGFWAALSVGAALTHFLFDWYVLRAVAPGAPWGLISVGLAAPFLVGAERLVRWRQHMAGATEALGYLAAGVSFFIAAAIPLELSREWITVAYALELAAVAAIADRLDLVAMRRICWGLLAVVVARFVFNPAVLKYPLGVTPLFNWILWGYGISIAALAVGARYLRTGTDERLVRAVEAAIALLAFVLLTLEVRSLFQPEGMGAPRATFMERACYVLIWGAFSLAALWVARWRRDLVTLWTWRLSAVAVVTVLGIQVLIDNPINAKVDVGQLPIANGLLLAYAVPAAMAVLARRWVDVERNKDVTVYAAVIASILAFVYVSLEVRHFFDPGFTRRGYGAEGFELYAYSFVWLLFGVGLLALGFVRGMAALRHAGMVLVCIVVAKVFLIDMAGLHGLLRVVSFLGLGAALLGLGFAYRHLGFDVTPKK